MSQEEGPDGPELVGRPVADAVEAVLAGDDSRDRERVRATLERVAEDGLVSRRAIEDELGELAKVVSTPETRVEIAAMGLSDARETAESDGVAGLDTVRARIDTFEARLGRLEEEVGALGPELRELVDGREGANVYEVASGIRELEAEANELHGAADELGVEVEEFDRWLADPGTRYDEVEEELEAVEGSLDALRGTVEDLAAVGPDADGPDGEDPDLPVEPAAVWADATLRTRVTSLLLADLRVELADLRAWPEGARGDVDRLEAFDRRLADLEGRCGDLTERLADLARPAWRDRYGERVDGFEAAMEDIEPPVAWEEVEAELKRRREWLGEG